MKDRIVVGYWATREKRAKKEGLPWPKEGAMSDARIRKILQRMRRAEIKATEARFKGHSTCRLCGIENGATEFCLTLKKTTWVWPQGLAHYIKEHGVRPPKAFRLMLREHFSESIR